jgi:hypothetical protein
MGTEMAASVLITVIAILAAAGGILLVMGFIAMAKSGYNK